MRKTISTLVLMAVFQVSHAVEPAAVDYPSCQANASGQHESLYDYTQRGSDYLYGRNSLSKQVDKALEIFKDSAQQGCSLGAAYLGSFYMYGMGVKVDYAQAAKWFLEASHKNDSYSQVHLGVLHLHGQGVEQNNQKALEYFKMASDKGQIHATYNLAHMYRKGLGVTQNDDQARELFLQVHDKATGLLKLEAQTELGIMEYKNGDYKKALYLLEPVALRQGFDAMYYVGKMYLHGQGVEKDYLWAHELFMTILFSAADTAYSQSCYCSYNVKLNFRLHDLAKEMALIYEQGLGVQPSALLATYLLSYAGTEAAEQHQKLYQSLSPKQQDLVNFMKNNTSNRMDIGNYLSDYTVYK